MGILKERRNLMKSESGYALLLPKIKTCALNQFESVAIRNDIDFNHLVREDQPY